MLSTKGRSRKGNEWLGWSTCHRYFSSTVRQSISGHVNIHNKQNSLVLERGKPPEVLVYTQEMGLATQGRRSCRIHRGMFELIGTNNTESCAPSARCSQMRPVELLLVHIQVKPIYCQATCALTDSGQAWGGRSDLVKSCNSGFGEKMKKPFTTNGSSRSSGKEFLFFLLLRCNTK